MNPERWERVKAVFEAASAATAGERQSILNAACSDDAQLLVEVQSLLASHERAGAFLETPAAARVAGELASDGQPRVGQRIGPYRLLEAIGHGGMGTVYRAVRDDGVHDKEIALKLVAGGPGSTLFFARFRQEREILAKLDHPSIARLLDGGTSEDGRPFYAMEYVDGLPIDVYCSRHALGIRERLEIFRGVCAAVEHAHRHLVVHRDLKPGNILVAADGTPKLLDFGIAKLLQPEAGATALTATAVHPMTPDYASPEQVRGEAVTTSTDVYSLGMVLYLLLTGRRPYVLATTNPEELLRLVCHSEAKAPSMQFVKPGEARQRQALVGDLDTIVLRALAKEPARRYPSVEQLSEDISRHLAGLPVRARQDTLGYRAGKFVRRNRGLVAAAGLVLVSLVGGILATARQARIAETNRARAEQRFRDARRIANSLLFELHDEIAGVSGATKASALLLTRASEWLDALAADAPDDAALEEELATAYHKLGDALGGGGVSNLGQTNAALAAFRKGLALRKKLAAQAPNDAARQERLAATHTDIAYALPEGPEALAHAQSALQIAQSLRSAQPGDRRIERRLGQSFFALGAIRAGSGDLVGGEPPFSKAAAIFERLLAADPKNRVAERDVALTHKRLGAILAKQGRTAEALPHYKKAFSVEEARVAREPESVEARRDLSSSLVDLGWILGSGNDARGELEQYRRALLIREQLAKEDPANAFARNGLASLLGRLGAAHGRLAENQQALAYLARAETLLAPSSDSRDQEDLAQVRYKMAVSNLELGRPAEALRHARRALEGHQALSRASPGNSVLAESLAWDHLALARALMASSAASDATPEAVAVRQQACREYREASRIAAELQAAGRPVDNGSTMLELIGAGLARCAPPR